MHYRGKNLAALALAGSLGLAACQTQNAYTDERQTSNTTKGALIGGAGGALIGGLAGGSGHGALIGAGIGALAGGSVGYYMDRQEEDLRRELRASGVSVTRRGDNIQLNMQDDVLFDVNSAELSTRARRILRSVATVLQEYRQTLIDVNGYTDTTGTAAHNRDLSQRRAEAVAEYLVDNGVESVRISPQGFGETDLRIRTADGVNEPRNRRVEIQLAPYTG